MTYGICNLSMAPLKLEPLHQSGMISQVLYGEEFQILEKGKRWSRVQLLADGCEGWIDNLQFLQIPDSDYQPVMTEDLILSADLMEFVAAHDNQLMPIPLGSVLNFVSRFNHEYQGDKISGKQDKSNLLNSALLFLNAPYLWGGRSPFGIDASGLIQMVYRLNGVSLPRSAKEQAELGVPLSFIEESEPGDLVFFDDDEGLINHVGIILEDNHIIHASGKVRIDRLDHFGIFNPEKGQHTHKLRLIKRII